jgi:hypothetical protein
VLALRGAQELPDCVGIAERAMPLAAGDAVALDHAVEVVTRLRG